ncbi:MAG: hypothetical protein CL992_04725 [Euryarchaeota archaeon]|nr:hypothetical protein [Euryarchaeota archaeon]
MGLRDVFSRSYVKWNTGSHLARYYGIKDLKKEIGSRLIFDPNTEGVMLYWASSEASIPKSNNSFDINKDSVNYRAIKDYESILFYDKGNHLLQVKQKVRLSDSEILLAKFKIECRISGLDDGLELPDRSKKLIQMIHDEIGTGSVGVKDLEKKLGKRLSGSVARDLLSSIDSRDRLYDNESRVTAAEKSFEWIQEVISKWGLDLMGLDITYQINDLKMRARIKRERERRLAKAELDSLEIVDWEAVSRGKAETVEAVEKEKNKQRIAEAKAETEQAEQSVKDVGHAAELDRKKREKDLKVAETEELVELGVDPEKAMMVVYDYEEGGKKKSGSFIINSETLDRLDSAKHSSSEIDARITAIEKKFEEDLKDEDQVQVWAALGVLYSYRGKFEKAARYIDKSINLSNEINVNNHIAIDMKVQLLWYDGANDLYDYPEDYSREHFENASLIEQNLQRLLLDSGDHRKREEWEKSHQKILGFLSRDPEEGEGYARRLEEYE